MREHIKITFVGDLLCFMEQNEASLRRHGKYFYDDVFSGVKDILSDTDYLVGNLETPTAGEDHGFTSAAAAFNTPVEFLDSLDRAGFDFLSTANNHCLDRGVGGLMETLRQIKRRGFDTSGSYQTKDESDEIFIKEIAGLRFAFLCFTYGTNSEYNKSYLKDSETWLIDLLKKQAVEAHESVQSTGVLQRLKSLVPASAKRSIKRILHIVDTNSTHCGFCVCDSVSEEEINNKEHEPYLTRLERKIIDAKSKADIVIVLPHMGGQFNSEPGPYALHMMEKISSYNVDLVVASHSHTPLPCKCFPNGTVGAYSLGNFCFTPGVGIWVDEVLSEYGIVLNVFFDKSKKKATRATFSLVKSVVDEDGYSKCVSVNNLFEMTEPGPNRDAIANDNETVVKRFMGASGDIAVKREYELGLGMSV